MGHLGRDIPEPPWFTAEDEGSSPHGLAYKTFRELSYADCPVCRTGGSDPDKSATFVDAVLPDGGDPGLHALFEGADIDIQFDYSFVNNPDWTEQWDFAVNQTSPTRKSIFRAIHKINVNAETDGTVTLPTVETDDSDVFGPYPPFYLGGVVSQFDDPDRRWGRGFVWTNNANPFSTNIVPISDQTSRHEETRYSRVVDCTLVATQPSDPSDIDHDYDITSYARLYRIYFRVCRTADGQYKLSLLATGGIRIVGEFTGGISSVGAFQNAVEFFIYTGDWSDVLPFFNLSFRDPEFHNSIDLSSLPTDVTLSDEEELASELFGATVNWRHTNYSHEYNTHETPVVGDCSLTGSTTHKITLNEGESSIEISNLIVTATMP